MNVKEEKPLDDVERAERTVLWRETVERRVERDADVVHFLSEDRGDVAEGGWRGAGERSVFLLRYVIWNGVDERNSRHRFPSVCVSMRDPDSNETSVCHVKLIMKHPKCGEHG